MEDLYFHILYAPLNSIVKLKISSSMNFLTNKMSLDVSENCIKIEQKRKSNVEQHIEMQLILIDDYRLLIVCFHMVTSLEQVSSGFPEAVLNICTCIQVVCFSQYHTRDGVLIFWTFSQCCVEVFLYMDQNMVFP